LFGVLRASFDDLVTRSEPGHSEQWWHDELDKKLAAGGMSAITVDGEVVGLLNLYTSDDGAIDLDMIALAPDRQSAGLGTRVLRDVMASAPRVHLRVRKGNAAKALYDRLGFRVVKETDIRWFMEYP
jgi:ribosomal protein S18 acetylase RimI-like enzyme